MINLSKSWRLDSTLERDTFPLWQHDLWLVRLVNDARWPWVMVVPKTVGAEDVDDLPLGVQTVLLQETARLSRALKSACSPPLLKTNVATIGNVVRQFHLHVVGRREGDPNWPGPIWGFETAQAYTPEAAESFARAFQNAYNSS